MDGIILYLNAIDIPAWIIKGGKLVFINEILGNDFQTNIEELNNIKKSSDGNSSIIKDLHNAIYNLPYKNNIISKIGNFNYRLKVANLENDICIVSLIKISEVISYELLQNCIDSIPDIIFYKDENLKYKIINKKCKLFYENMGIHDVIGKNDLELTLDDNFIKTCNKHDLMAINSRKAVYMEEKVPKSESDEFYIYQTIKADNALFNISKVLKSIFKSDLVFRVGGEEFLII